MKKITSDLSKELLEFIDSSPSVFHVIESIKNQLKDFICLEEGKDWKIEKGKSYYVVRKDSSVIAFRVPEKDYTAIRMMAAHSDSPSFKIKPDGLMNTDMHYSKVNTEGYGGMIMYSWLDRPLSVAGRAVVRTSEGLKKKLINIDRDLMLIPSVAIHMNRDVNKGYTFNAKTDTIPLLGDKLSQDGFKSLIAQSIGTDAKDILGTDLFLYVRQKGTIWGADNEYISSRALDDLQCVFAGVKALSHSKNASETLNMLCVFDNEEVGSLTGQGADSTFLSDTIKRINLALSYDDSVLLKGLANGYMISADNAHAVHPNHPEYADATNKPYLNEGIVIKYNASQKYTTDACSEAMLRDICDKAKVPVQTFSNRSDMAGGSTLGNISNRHISVRTVDIGLPQLAMHSAIETAGVRDIEYLYKALVEYWR